MPGGRKKQPRPVVGDLSDPYGMVALMERFLEWMAVQNYSKQTIKTRRCAIEVFLVWCDERSITRPGEVTLPILERYKRHIYLYRTAKGKPMTINSQVNRLVGVRMFFKWLARNNHILFNPAADMELPRQEKRLPKNAFTASEAEQVLSQPDLSHPRGIRDRAILETLYSTGMRRSELSRLKLYDVDANKGIAIIEQGKGKKDRVVPIGERALAWIEKYIDEARPSFTQELGDGPLFVVKGGSQVNPGYLTQLAKTYIDAADTGKRGACHIFRHTMATLMLEGGADLRCVQEILGHADLSSTQIYTQVSIKRLKEVHTRTHPAKMERENSKVEDEPDPTPGDLLAILEQEARDEENEI